jgi:FkbM family methyltransferase
MPATQNGSASLRQIDRKGQIFHVADTHPEFWDSLASGQWEPETFALFDHFLDASTVHVDIGAWIGPTVLYAATRARQVIGFEPDPVAFAALEITAKANHHLSPIVVHPVAIARQSGELVMGSKDRPGDSMSSSLFAQSDQSWHAQARCLEEFESSWPASAPVFLKIDIEGGEYELLPALANFVRRRQPDIYLSLHSHLFLGDSVNGGFMTKAINELRLFWRFLRFWPVFRQFPFIYSHRGQRLSRWRLFHRATWRRTYALVLSHRPLPKLLQRT